MNLIFTIASCLLFMHGNVHGDETTTQTSGGEGLTVLPLDVKQDNEILCDASTKEGADMKVDITGMMDYDDLLRLTIWNSKHDLESGEKEFEFPAEVNWKRSVLSNIQAIFAKGCPNEFVPPGFIRVAKELFMIYLNSAVKSFDRSESWKSFQMILEDCLMSTEKLNMTSIGFKAQGLQVETKDGKTEIVPIIPPTEAADSSPDIDVIVDTIWWLFSFSFGTCYWSAQHPSIWAAKYKRLFYVDFLQEMRPRWLHAGPTTDFGVIFGDFNLPLILHNIRMCVTATYTSNGLADRQLVRSVMLAPFNLGVEAGLNKKIML